MEQKNIKHTNLEFINLLYIIGTLLVVLGHATSNYLGNWGPKNIISSPTAVLINKYVYSFHMPLFFFISGYIFKFNANNGKYREFKPFIYNKFKRLIIPYICVGLLYVSPIKYILGDYTKINVIPSVIKNILIGVKPSQLWFLLTLFNIYIIYYFFRKIVDSNISNNLAIIISIAAFGSFVFFKISISNKFQIYNTLIYTIYFHLGYIVCSKAKIENFIINTPLLLFIVHSFVFAISRFKHIPLGELIIPILGTLAYFSLSFTLINKYPNIAKYKVYNVIRKYNLQIYLYHQQIILILLTLNSFRKLSPILVITISSCISITLSIILAKIVKNFSNIKFK